MLFGYCLVRVWLLFGSCVVVVLFVVCYSVGYCLLLAWFLSGSWLLLA